MYLKQSLKSYLDQLASESPVPGGGGTSALAASLGMALALMVGKITLKHLDKRRQRSLKRTIRILEHLRRDAQQIINLDPKVYREVMASYRRLKKAGKSREDRSDVETALSNAFRLQADLALMVTMAKQLLPTVDSFTKGSIRNDLMVSSALLDGAFRGAIATARINVMYMKKGKRRSHFEQALRKLEQKYKRFRFE